MDQDDSESVELLGDQQFDDRPVISTIAYRENSLSTTFVTIALLVFFSLDIIAFAFIAKLILATTQSIAAVENMEFRNPYVGLDALYSSRRIRPSQYASVINEPRLAVQVSLAKPNEVFPFDTHRWLSDFGLLSPPDRHFQVSSGKEVQTIVQFNILDYGMEDCSLIIRLPHHGDNLPHPFVVPDALDAIPLWICEIHASRPLKEQLISWSTRPKCIRPLPITEAQIGQEIEIERFACKTGTFLGYQIACADSSPLCDIDVWTNQNETWGVFIRQYQSIG